MGGTEAMQDMAMPRLPMQTTGQPVALVKIRPAPQAPAVMAATITDRILENSMETTEIKVAGMTCGSCVASVTKALKRVPGVADVQVDLASGTARVTGEKAGQHVPALLGALSDAGYEASASSAPASAGSPRPGGCHDSKSGHGTKGHGGCCCH